MGEKSKGLLVWPHKQLHPSSPPTFAVLQWTEGRIGWGTSGKSITLAGQACSCDLPSTESPPCLLPAAQGPAREMQLILGLGCDRNQWPWPAQRLPRDGRTAGPSALEDFGAASQHHSQGHSCGSGNLPAEIPPGGSEDA